MSDFLDTSDWRNSVSRLALRHQVVAVHITDPREFELPAVGILGVIDPETGHNFDDTKRYIDQLPLSPDAKATIYEGNAKRVYGRLAKQLEAQFA